MSWPERLSLNQFSTEPRPLPDVIDACARAGVTAIGLSGRRIERFGVDEAARLIKNAGLRVSIYQAVGYWASGDDAEGKRRDVSDLVRNLEEANKVGAEVVGISSGGMKPGDRNLREARSRVAKGLTELAPLAAARGVKVAVEPIHPFFGPTRGVLFTLGETLDILDEIGSDHLGINFETHHQWWDPDLPRQFARVGDRIFIVQINDWAASEVDRLNNRSLMGEGCIDFSSFTDLLSKYDGRFDVEANSAELRALPLPVLIERVAASYEQTLGLALSA